MPLKVPQLDDRTFEQIVQETKSRIPSHTPEWNNFNDSDPGITIVQLFAFMAENLLYRSNRIPEKNRLKFLSLLGLPLRPATPGRGLVAFNNDRGPIDSIPFVAGQELRAGNVPFITRTDVDILPVTALAFYKRKRTLDPNVPADEAIIKQYSRLYATQMSDGKTFEYYQSVPLDAPEIGKSLPEIDLRDTLDYSLWVALLAPKGVNPDLVRNAIQDKTLALGVFPSIWTEERVLDAKTLESQRVTADKLYLRFELPLRQEVANNEADNNNKAPRYASLEVESADNVLDMPGIVQLKLPPEIRRLWEFDPDEEGTGDYPPLLEDQELGKRLVTWVRVRLVTSNPTADPLANNASQPQAVISWVGANAAQVIQAVPVKNERLGVGTGNPEQTFKVTNTPVVLAPDLGQGPETAFVLDIQDEQGQWQVWRRIDDIYGSKASDMVYTLDPESGIVTFGDGLQGMRPLLGSVIRVSYKYGGGLQGKVNINGINKSPGLPGGIKVANPVATWGATEGESAEQGERRISFFLKHRDRLVTAEDFKEIAAQTPGVDIGRVEAVPLLDPDIGPAQTMPGVVTIMVVPQHDIERIDPPIPDRLFLDEICRYLEPRRLLTTKLFIRGPIFVNLYISVAITVLPGQVSSIINRRVKDAIRTYLSPLVGGPVVEDPDDPTLKRTGTGWPLDVKLANTDLIAAAYRVPGVQRVGGVRLAYQRDMTLPPVEDDEVEFNGIELPWLAVIEVTQGDADGKPEDPLDLFGKVSPPPGDNSLRLAVPLVGKQC